jgi:Gluconate 2-dehydrogenase subunit 3
MTMDDQDQQHHHDHHDDHDHGHDHDHSHEHPTRRDVLKGIGAAAAAMPFLSPESAEALQQIRSGAAGSKFLFFTRAQHATVDALSERLIPADDHSPGARAAKVADFIDLYVGEAPAEVKAAWTEGLTALEQASQEKFKVPFVKASAEQQVELLTEASRGETDPKTPLERFFVESKARTIQGYYTSKIGIHQELGYKGNQFLPEFVGYAEQS